MNGTNNNNKNPVHTQKRTTATAMTYQKKKTQQKTPTKTDSTHSKYRTMAATSKASCNVLPPKCVMYCSADIQNFTNKK